MGDQDYPTPAAQIPAQSKLQSEETSDNLSGYYQTAEYHCDTSEGDICQSDHSSKGEYSSTQTPTSDQCLGKLYTYCFRIFIIS